MAEIDYDSIAQKHGAILAAPSAPDAQSSGEIDYDALARQHGAVPSSSEPPGPLSRFASSAAAAITSIPAGVKEWAARPSEISQAMDASHTLNQARTGALPTDSPQVQAAVERGMNARIGSPNFVPPAVPSGSEPIVKAGGQVKQGDYAGAAGTMVGSYGPLAVPLAIKAKGPSISSGLRRSAETEYAQALRPTTVANKKIAARIVPSALDRGITGGIDSLQSKAKAGVRSAGEDLNDAMLSVGQQKPPLLASVQPVLDSLDRLRDASVVNGVILNPRRVKAIDQLKQTLSGIAEKDPNGGATEISFESLRKARQDLDSQVGDGHIVTPKVASANLVLKRTTDAIRSELAQASPDIAKINAEYSFWKNLERVVDATKDRTTSQAPGLGGRIMGGAGIAGELARSGSAVKAVVAGSTLKGLTNLINSAGWKTTSAVTKAKLASAIANGNSNLANNIIAAKLAASGQREDDQGPPQFAQGGVVKPKKKKRWYGPPPMPKQKAQAPPPMPI